MDNRINNEQSKKEKEMKKECRFKPSIDKSGKSYTQNDPYYQQATGMEGAIKGLSTHIQRQIIAKQRKMQGEEVFLLPSQRKQLQKIRTKEA